MRLSTLTLVILASKFLAAEPLPVNFQTSELICSPTDPTNCYPKLFVPTHQWQPIQPGQDIPGGLHVRLNIDTLQKEAKLLDSSDEATNDLVIVAESQDPSPAPARKPHKLDMTNINSFDSALDEVQSAANGAGSDSLDQALDVLIDLSHDIEFGTKLASDGSAFSNLNAIAAKSSPPVQEKVYRIIGSSLRNNPEAIATFVDKDTKELIGSWIKQLDTSDNLVKKRVLGIFHQLVTNARFKYQYFNGDFDLLSKFIDIYPKLNKSTKTRLLNILEDLKLVDEPSSESDDSRVSNYIQAKFLKSDFKTEDQFKLYYQTLVEIHQADKSLQGSKAFVTWLDEESGKRQQGLKERDGLYSNADKQFDKDMLETRHTVFGNPNAMRKHFDDEL